MADDIIGSLGIQIEADASDLPGQYDAAVTASENAAERIASAFESVVGIGEALAITEGLKEFGTEALNAYGAVQSVTVAMTAMTGSVERVGEAVEAVKEISATEPFAFPELAATMQRMLALGVQLEEIPLVLQSAANVAAATGNSLAAVGQSIDRMALSGAVAQRQLTQLGLSTNDLAAAMGVAASQVKAAFLAMDESQRLDVLTTALEKFSGAATAQANTVKGAWQILQNQFEEVMVGVGAALEPAIKDIIAFGTQAVHYAQEVIDAFNKLPEPVKEFSGAVAIAAASLAPLTVAIGTLGLGITGISAALGPIKELFGGFGEAAAEAAVAEGEAATAATAVAEGVGAAGLAFGGVEVVIGAVGAALVGLELRDQVEQWQGIYQTLKNNADVFFSLELSVKNVGIALADAVGQSSAFEAAWSKVSAIIKNTPIQDILTGPLSAANDILKALNVTLQVTAGDLPAADAMAKQAAASMQALADKTAAAAVQAQIHSDKLTGVQLALNNLGKTTADEAAQVAFWTTAVQQAGAQLDGTAAKAEVYNAALQKLDAAQKTLNAGNKDYMDTLAGMTEAYNKQQGVITTLENTLAQLASVENRTDAQETIMVETANKLATARKAETQATVTLKAAIDDLPKAYDGLVTSADAFLKKEQDVATAVGYAKSVMDQAMATNDGSAASQRAVTDALNQYVDKLKASGAAMTDQITINVHGVDVITTLGNAIDTVKQSQGDWTNATINGVQVLKDHTAVTQAATAAITAHGVAAQGTALIIGNLSTSVQKYTDDTSKAINENSSLANSFTSVTDSASGAVNYLDKSAASVNQLGADANGNVDNMSRFANSINGVTNAVGAMSTALDDADRSMNAFVSGASEKLGSVDALAIGAWTLATQLGNLPAEFAGTGSARNSQGQYVSAFDELSAAEQRAGAALATATTATVTHTTATVANSAATTTATTATSGLTSAVSTLSSTASAVSTATSATAAVQQSFVDGLGNVYNSYQALVDAIRNNPLLAGPAVSQSGSGVVGSGASSAPAQQYVDGMGNVYSSLQALQQALAANPGLAGPHQASGQLQTITPASGGTNQTFTIGGRQVSMSEYLDSLGSSGGFSGGASAGTSPTGPGFGLPSSNLSNQSGTAIVVNLHYPQFNTQQQAQQVISQVVQQLRTSAGLKL